MRPLTLIFLIASLPALAPASVIYSNLGPGDSFGTFNFFTSNPGQPNGEMAVSFTALSDCTLDRIEVPLGLMPAVVPPPLIRATIYTTGSVFPWPDTALDTVWIDLTGYPSGTGAGYIIAADFVAHPQLSGGRTYWLSLGGGQTYVGWRAASEPDPGRMLWGNDNWGNMWFESQPQGWYPAFRVTGTEVPEPATGAVAAFALLLICSLLKRRTSGSDAPPRSADLRV